MKNTPILMDGSFGTALWNLAERNGIEKVSVWRYSAEHPELVNELYREYIEAGSLFIQTNTFSANSYTVEKETDYSTAFIIKKSAEIAIKAAQGTGVIPYLSCGPLPRFMMPYGELSEESVFSEYSNIVSSAYEAGIQYIMFETFMDVQMIAEAVKAAKNYPVKVICAMTFERGHKTLVGDSVDDIIDTLAPLEIDGIGLNCSCNPVESLKIIKEFHNKTDIPLYFKPNAGSGDSYNAEQFCKEIGPAVEFVKYIGGCCGTDSSYIRSLKKLLERGN